MTLRLRTERMLLGLYGLALLRGWPYGDEAEADANIEAMRALLGDAEALEVLEVDDLEYAEAYAEWAETYDAANALVDSEETTLRALLADVPAGRAADLASGTGRLAQILTNLGHEVVAVDSSLPMLSRSQGKGAAALHVVGDILHVPVATSAVDLALCGLALTHVENLEIPLTEIRRIVRPGGHVVLSDVHPVAVAFSTQAMFKRADGSRGVTRNLVHWTGDYVNAFLTAGLEIERCAEVLVDQRFVEELPTPELREAGQASLLGIPLCLVWRLRRP